MNDSDWDAGTENAYERYLDRVRYFDDEDGAVAARNAASGFCTRCGFNPPAPTEEWCVPCVLEVETALAELEEQAA